MTKAEALASIKGKKYYLWYENDANIFSLFLSVDARTKGLRNVLGTVYAPIIITGKNNYFKAYLNKQDDTRIAEIILNKIEKETNWFITATQEIYKRAEKLITFSRQLKEINYKEKSNKELAEMYQKFVTLFEEMRVYSSIPTMLEHGSPVLTNKLKKLLEGIKNVEEQNKVFSILTTPHKKSYLLEEDLERLAIAVEMKKDRDVRDKIKKHTEKWLWKEYMFEGTPITEEEFTAQIKKDITENPEEKIAHIEQIHKEIIQKQEACIQRYKLSKKIQELSKTAQDIVFLKYFRKGIFAESYYCVEFLLREIAKRLNLTLNEIRAMVDYEVKEALENNTLNREEIKKRLISVATIGYEGKTYFLTEDEVAKIEKENIVEEVYSEELKGTVACSGKATGRACIINKKEDMTKMQKGDIFVSIMTNPNMFSAMKQAAAIVTDIGGLSCHAAIVARELQIPCIVGTKNATKVLKDNMKVEVNANKGTITIIKEKK